MSLSRAYSILHVKAVDAETRTFSGLASTPEPDRVGDVVEPKGATFRNPVSLLLFHKHDLPVGTAVFGTPTADGVPFTASIPEVPEPGKLKDRVDEAWQSVKHRVVRGVSIGFRVLEDGVELLKSGGYRFTKIEILELSLVSVPANAAATIATIKSLDAPYLAESGTGPARVVDPPSAVVDPTLPTARKGAIRMNKKPNAETIASLEATRAAKSAELLAIQEKVTSDGRTKDANERQSFDDLKAEIAGLDAELKDLRDLEALNVAAAVPVQGTSVKEATASRSGAAVVVMEPKLPPGIGFARGVKARIVARLDGRNPLDVAKEMYPSDQRLHAHLQHDVNIKNMLMQMKAAVPAASTTVSAWAGALVDPTNLAGEFIDFLRPASIIGRLNLREVPTNVRIIEQTGGGTGYWVGQGAPKPLTQFGYAPITLTPTKVAAIAVATEEALRYSTPSLDQLIRDGLRGALVERVDRDLLDPAEAGTANVQPASLTNSVTPLVSSGSTAEAIRADISALIGSVRAAGIRGTIAIVMPDSLLTSMAWMSNALGQPEFPGVTGEGGMVNGVRFIGSDYVANTSANGNLVVAIAENEVFYTNDGGVTVDASREASLQMLDDPTNHSVTPTPTTLVSMWQTNSVAFRGEWFVNWQKRRADAVAYMADVTWGVGSP